MKASELTKLNNLLYLTSDSLTTISPEESSKNIESNIRTWLANGTIIRLKRGCYITREMYDKYKLKKYNERTTLNIRKPGDSRNFKTLEH